MQQARDNIALEEHLMSDLKMTKAEKKVLEHAILTRNYAPLVMVTDDPAYRFLLTTFTIDHVSTQAMTMFHFYKHLIRGLEENLEHIYCSGKSNAK